MWNSPLLYVRVKVLRTKPRVRFRVTIAFFCLHRLLLSVNALRSFLPGRIGAYVQGALDSIHALILSMMAERAQQYVNIDVQNKQADVRVEVATVGLNREPKAYSKVAPPPRMMAIVLCFASCAMALAVMQLTIPGTCDISGLLFGSLWLTLFYTLLRPLLHVLLLPLNLLLLGLLTPLGDALFLLWAAAWSPGLTLTYWQGVLAAVLISAFFWPYSIWKQRSLSS